MMLLLLLSSALAQEPCPTDQVCLTKAQYAEVYKKLQELETIEESQPSILLTGALDIVTDKMGRVYSNESIPIHGNIHWGHVEADFNITSTVVVSEKVEPTFGFKLHPKAVFGVAPLSYDRKDPISILDIGLGMEYIHYKDYDSSVYVGSRTFGLDVGYSFFNSSGVEGGVRWTWPGYKTLPMTGFGIGWFFRF